MKTNYIKQFLFGTAQYNILDKNDVKLTLVVNYKDNTYKILGGESNQKSSKELQSIAKQLLERKHNRNFAEHN